MVDRPHGIEGADARIAELEGQLRKREALEREQHLELRDLKAQLAEVKSELRSSDAIRAALVSASADAAGDLAKVLERLAVAEETVEAARDAVEAYEEKRHEAGALAFARLIVAVRQLPKRAS